MGVPKLMPDGIKMLRGHPQRKIGYLYDKTMIERGKIGCGWVGLLKSGKKIQYPTPKPYFSNIKETLLFGLMVFPCKTLIRCIGNTYVDKCSRKYAIA